MKKHILFCLVLLLIIPSSCSFIKKARPKPVPAQKSEQCEFKKNPEKYYYGEVFVDITNEKGAGMAREEAKRMAREDLAKNIKVWVKSEVKDRLRLETHGASEKMEENFEIISTNYAEMGLEEVEVDTKVDPEAKIACALAQVEKEGYREKVRRDIDLKKERVKGEFSSYLGQAQPNFKVALDHLLAARASLEVFQGLPVKGDLNGDGKEEEFLSTIDSEIREAVGKIEIRPLSPKVAFGADGRAKSQVIFELRRLGLPIGGLPVKFSFITGDGRLGEDAQTSQIGTAELRVNYINPATREAVVRARINLPALETGGFTAPYADVEFYKTPTVAYSVAVVSGESANSPQGFLDQVNDVLVKSGFEAVKAPKPISKEPESGDFSLYQEKGADYMLVVILRTATGEAADFGLSYANTSAVVTAYSVIGRGVVFTFTLPAVRGVGGDAGTARWDSIGKLRAKLFTELEQQVKAMPK